MFRKSVMARRLKDGHVQYGWCGGGCFSNKGVRLVQWYQKPEDVEYLFSLGETNLIGKKGSENGGFSRNETHDLLDESFWLDTTERKIFSKVVFAEEGYFYDIDEKWYYIFRRPFLIKIPLMHLLGNLDESGDELMYLITVEDKVLKYIFGEYTEKNREFKEYLEEQKCDPAKILEDITEDIIEGGNANSFLLWENYRNIFQWFDEWILVKTSEDDEQITDIVVRKKEEKHIETCESGNE